MPVTPMPIGSGCGLYRAEIAQVPQDGRQKRNGDPGPRLDREGGCGYRFTEIPRRAHRDSRRSAAR